MQAPALTLQKFCLNIFDVNVNMFLHLLNFCGQVADFELAAVCCSGAAYFARSNICATL